MATKAKSRKVSALSLDRQWQARDDLRVLQQAQEIQQNKARLARAKAEAEAQMAALAKTTKAVK
jgi:hypothetical protein